MNIYAYVGGNPLVFVDPYGLDKASVSITGSAVISGAGGAVTISGGIDEAGQVCVEVSLCGRAGLGTSSGVRATGGASEGDYCEGTSTRDGVFGSLGPVSLRGPMPNSSGQSDISSVLIGPGTGVSAGAEACVTQTICF